MKLAITGKGGVGKTTLASLLAKLWAQEGRTVLAIDADPDANLAGALGLNPQETAKLIPIADMKDLVEERTGMKPGTIGGYFKLNPHVEDIPDKYAANVGGIKLLVMGTVQTGGGGCACPENILLKTLVRHLLLRRQEVVILDMEAGIEHLGRGTAEAVDAFIVVVEPGRRSIQTAEAVKKLANDIGISRVYVVGSKVRNEEDKEFIKISLPDFKVLGFISYNPKISEADMRGLSVFDTDVLAVAEAREIKETLEKLA